MRLVVKAGSVLEDPDQQGLAHFVEHMQFEGTRHFPGGRHQRVPGLARPGHRSRRERGDELRRHAVHAAHSGRLAAGARSRAARARGLGAWRHVRSGRHRPAACHRPVRVAAAPRRRRAHAGQDPPGAARGIALRESSADWRSRRHRKGAARTAAALLSRLVPARSDGGDRRRRRGSRRHGRDDQGALLAARRRRCRSGRGRRSTCPSAPGTRYTVIADKEATATAVAISNLRPARAQDSVGGYRQIMMDQLFGDMLDARLDELDQRENPPFLRAGAGRRLFDTPRTKDEVLLQALVPSDGVTQRARRARDRDSARHAIRVHSHRAGARQAGQDAQLRAQRHGESRPRVVEPRRRIHAKLPAA